ncbi:MAG: hypothetical protein IPK23_11955 [Rhizobiales bacterium]|nr:hypothetical protein [Hyphomicrobiales bacterium]
MLIEADTGKVILEQDAGKPWHPASVTKLMTTYVTFRRSRRQAAPLFAAADFPVRRVDAALEGRLPRRGRPSPSITRSSC